MPTFRLTTTQHISRVYVIEAEDSDKAKDIWRDSLGTEDAEQDYTSTEEYQDTEEVPPDNNKGFRPKCIACGSREELTPVEPGLFKDAHLCRACADRARALTEDKDI